MRENAVLKMFAIVSGLKYYMDCVSDVNEFFEKLVEKLLLKDD